MKYHIQLSGRFKKQYKLCMKRGLDDTKLELIIKTSAFAEAFLLLLSVEHYVYLYLCAYPSAS